MPNVANPFAITFGDLTVGGATSYQLLGPHVVDKTFESIRIVFDVVISATSYASLQSLSQALEDAFSRRLTAGDTVVISLSGAEWTYTVGTSILHVQGSCAKSGNPETDTAHSRAYTCTIEGELPADDDDGLRDIEVLVDYAPSRQKTVTIRGTYTATDAGTAKAVYESEADDEATTYLSAIDADATWELVDETYTFDRERSGGTTPAPHVLNFTRQYVQLLADQSQGQRDDDQIRDHRVVFTDLSQHPGDSKADVSRFRRVVGNYDCSVDVDETTDLHAVYDSKVVDHIKQLFRDEFNPSQFAIEDLRATFDHTGNRISVALQFVYQSGAFGESIVEVSQSVTLRETRSIDYTPTHEDDEFAYDADVGFATRERIWTRTVIVLGDQSPRLRLVRDSGGGAAGRFDDIGGQDSPDSGSRSEVQSDGWNIVGSTSQVTPQYIGDPSDQQIRVTVLSETVLERWHKRVGNRTTNPVRRVTTG